MVVHVRRPLVVFALVAAGAVLLASVAAHADDSDGDGVPDAIEEATARNVNGIPGEGGFRIQSVSVGAAPEAADDEFSVVFEKATFRVEYRPLRDREESVAYELTFKRVVELLDSSGDIGGGDIVQEWDLTNEYWVVVATDTTTVDGGRQFQFTTFPIQEVPTSRNVTLTVTASSRFVRLGGVLVSPMAVKIDVSIDGWVYDSPTSELAMKFELGANVAGVEIDEESADEARGWASGESQVNVSGELGSISFSWADTATVDTQPVAVRASNLSPGEGGNEFFLVYGRGSSIDQGAKMSVESSAFWTLLNRATQPPPLSWDPVLFALGAAAIAGLLAISVVVSRRQRRER